VPLSKVRPPHNAGFQRASRGPAGTPAHIGPSVVDYSQDVRGFSVREETAGDMGPTADITRFLGIETPELASRHSAREDDASRMGPSLAIACRPGAPARLGGESREHRTVERVTHEDQVTMALAEKAEVSTVRVCRIERKNPIVRVVEDGVGIQDGLVALSRRT